MRGGGRVCERRGESERESAWGGGGEREECVRERRGESERVHVGGRGSVRECMWGGGGV